MKNLPSVIRILYLCWLQSTICWANLNTILEGKFCFNENTPQYINTLKFNSKLLLFSCLCSQNAYIKSYSSFYDKYDRKSPSFSLIKNIISWKLHFPPVNSFDFNGFWSQMACIKWNNWPSHGVLISPQFGKLGHRVQRIVRRKVCCLFSRTENGLKISFFRVFSN